MFAYDLAFCVLTLVCLYLVVQVWRTGEHLRHLADVVARLETKVWVIQEQVNRVEMGTHMLPRGVPHGNA
jgi:hypothetical protein